MDNSVFEPIEHERRCLANVIITGMESSHYHWHYDYELLVVLKGSLQVFCGPEPMTMQEGDVLLVNSKMVHGYRGLQDNLCLFIQFDPKAFEWIAGEDKLLFFYLNSVNGMFPPARGYAPFVELSCRLGLAWYDNSPNAYLRMNALAFELLAELTETVQYDVRRYPVREQMPAEGKLVADVAAFMEAHCEEGNLVELLTREFGLSEKTLYRYTKSFLGMSPKEMIDKARVERARRLLRSSDCSISMVGQQCGFTNEATFHRVFKKETEMTPNEYRQGDSPGLVAKEIQGYLSVNQKDAREILQKYAQGR